MEQTRRVSSALSVPSVETAVKSAHVVGDAAAAAIERHRVQKLAKLAKIATESTTGARPDEEEPASAVESEGDIDASSPSSSDSEADAAAVTTVHRETPQSADQEATVVAHQREAIELVGRENLVSRSMSIGGSTNVMTPRRTLPVLSPRP